MTLIVFTPWAPEAGAFKCGYCDELRPHLHQFTQALAGRYDPESFADHPKSVTELRSDKSGRACDWTVRDMLIDTLRDIDSGKLMADMAVLIIRDNPAGSQGDTDRKVWRRQAGVNSYIESLGLLQRGIQLCNPGDRE